MSSEELKNEEKKQILEKLIGQLDHKGSLYYSSTSEIAQMLHQKIHQEKALNHLEFELVQDMAPRDIQILLSYHTV